MGALGLIETLLVAGLLFGAGWTVWTLVLAARHGRDGRAD